MRPDSGRESERATRAAKSCVTLLALILTACTFFQSVHEAVAVPELTRGILREETTVRIEPRPPVEHAPRLQEHLAEHSDVKVDSKPLPPQPAPSEHKPEAKPAPSRPAPVAKPKRKPPVVKKAPVARVEQKARDGAPKAAEDAASGTSLAAAAGTASGTTTDASAALAQIVAVIDAHKRYPRRARQTGTTGTVVLSVVVNDSGIVSQVFVKTPHPSVLLNRAALQAAQPLVGQKVPLEKALTIDVPVRFTLS